MMRVTVIIPVYNAEDFLHKAVASVLNQPEVAEVLLVEDGSSDKSLALCQGMADSYALISVLSHPDHQNKGVAASRNLGIRQAKYDFIAFLDADDYYLPNRFSKVKERFTSQEDVDGVYENIGLEKERESKSKLYAHIEKVEHDKLFESLQPIGNKVWFHINGLTVRRSIFKKCGLFDESLKTSEDTHMWFKMAAKAKLVPGRIDVAVAMSCDNMNSLTKDLVQVKKDFISMFLKLLEWCNKEGIHHRYKELVLNRLLFHVFNLPYKNRFSATRVKLRYLIAVLLLKPNHVIFESQVFKRYLGNFIGYNRFLCVLRIKNHR